MRNLGPPLVALGLSLAGCATVSGHQRASWTYAGESGTEEGGGPMALFGEPETMAFNVFRCNAALRTLEFEDIEAEAFDGGRPARVEAGGQSWSGEERMDPPDGVPVARLRLPLDHAVVTAIEGGAQPIRIVTAAGAAPFPNHRVIGRVIAECRSKAGR